MQRLEVSGAVRPIHGSLGVKRLITNVFINVGGYSYQVPVIFIQFELSLQIFVKPPT